MTKPSRWSVHPLDYGLNHRIWDTEGQAHYYRRLCAYYISEARRWMNRSRGVCGNCRWWSEEHGPAKGLMGCAKEYTPLWREWVEAPYDFGCNQWEAK